MKKALWSSSIQARLLVRKATCVNCVCRMVITCSHISHL